MFAPPTFPNKIIYFDNSFIGYLTQVSSPEVSLSLFCSLAFFFFGQWLIVMRIVFKLVTVFLFHTSRDINLRRGEEGEGGGGLILATTANWH